MTISITLNNKTPNQISSSEFVVIEAKVTWGAEDNLTLNSSTVDFSGTGYAAYTQQTNIPLRPDPQTTDGMSGLANFILTPLADAKDITVNCRLSHLTQPIANIAKLAVAASLPDFTLTSDTPNNPTVSVSTNTNLTPTTDSNMQHTTTMATRVTTTDSTGKTLPVAGATVVWQADIDPDFFNQVRSFTDKNATTTAPVMLSKFKREIVASVTDEQGVATLYLTSQNKMLYEQISAAAQTDLKSTAGTMLVVDFKSPAEFEAPSLQAAYHGNDIVLDGTSGDTIPTLTYPDPNSTYVFMFLNQHNDAQNIIWSSNLATKSFINKSEVISKTGNPTGPYTNYAQYAVVDPSGNVSMSERFAFTATGDNGKDKPSIHGIFNPPHLSGYAQIINYTYIEDTKSVIVVADLSSQSPAINPGDKLSMKIFLYGYQTGTNTPIKHQYESQPITLTEDDIAAKILNVTFDSKLFEGYDKAFSPSLKPSQFTAQFSITSSQSGNVVQYSLPFTCGLDTVPPHR